MHCEFLWWSHWKFFSDFLPIQHLFFERWLAYPTCRTGTDLFSFSSSFYLFCIKFSLSFFILLLLIPQTWLPSWCSCQVWLLHFRCNSLEPGAPFSLPLPRIAFYVLVHAFHGWHCWKCDLNSDYLWLVGHCPSVFSFTLFNSRQTRKMELGNELQKISEIVGI